MASGPGSPLPRILYQTLLYIKKNSTSINKMHLAVSLRMSTPLPREPDYQYTDYPAVKEKRYSFSR